MKWRCSLLAIVALFVSSCLRAQTPDTEKVGSTNSVGTVSMISCSEIGFHFEIARNYLPSSAGRMVEIFTDSVNINKPNLQALFACISNAYPEPQQLTINVETDWNVYQQVSGNSGSGISESNLLVRDPNRPWSRYYRVGPNTYFRYYLGGDLQKVETVVITGRARSSLK